MKLLNVRKIIFITLSNIGDVILTLPVLSALKDSFPEACIDVVVGPRPQEVFRRDPRVNRIFVYNKHAGLKDKIAFVKKLKAEKYDLAVDMKASLLPLLIGARYRTSMIAYSRRPRLFSVKLKHKRLIHLESLKSFGIIYKEQKNIYIDYESKKKIESILQESGIKNTDIIIGLCPGSRSHLKQWKKQGFIDVINNVLEDARCKVILIGDANEAVLSKEIIAGVNRQGGVIDLTGKTNLNELFALVEKFNLLLTGDSAAMHIASDLGVRVIAIFGPTDPEEYGPKSGKDIIIRKDLKCSPCKKAQCELVTHECMMLINAEEVLNAVKKFI